MHPGRGIDGFALTRIAPAKINLALHVVGQRADGYHLLESLVTFADAGDRIGLSLSDEDRFTVSGQFSGDLPLSGDGASGNLVLKARDLLRAELSERGIEAPPVHLHLEKNLPVASGIGGGSADAAAALMGLMELWKSSPGDKRLRALALHLGADVPMCLEGRPLVARGIGDAIEPLSGFPAFPMLLVNPRVAVPTPVIFGALSEKCNAPLNLPQGRQTGDGWSDALRTMRNDLEPPARTIAPVIGAVSDALHEAGAQLVRMSGSGATCFGLFSSMPARDAAARTLSGLHPDWYVLACSSTSGQENYHEPF